MWQRFQTLFLILASASSALLLVRPFSLLKWEGDLAAAQETPFSDGVLVLMDNPVLLALGALAAFTALVAVFLYRNRTWQMRISWMAVLLTVAMAAFAAVECSRFINSVPSGKIAFQAGTALPLAGIIFGIVAVIFIRKDEKLVKSMNRLR